MIKFKNLPATTRISLIGAGLTSGMMFVIMACFGEFMQPYTNRMAVVLLGLTLGLLLIAYLSFVEKFAVVDRQRLTVLEDVTSDTLDIVLDMPQGDELVERNRAAAQVAANILGHRRATKFATENGCGLEEVATPPTFGYRRDQSRSPTLRAYDERRRRGSVHDGRRSGPVPGHLG